MSVFVFGYGSLMNEQSLQKTLPGKKIWGKAVLKGWRRAFNKPGVDHRFLNITPDEGRQTEGVLLEVDDNELNALKKREGGYRLVDVTNQIKNPSLPPGATVFAFVAMPLDQMKVRRSYLETLLAGMPADERARWLEETDFCGAEVDESG